ncbi:uncharacterized protein LOC141818410 [Curcuma longa]|uniref:uncharacterized protein LOC141818410 n=1 Tax=Curcuma longa TaxID=136217 RepID=UPI003D9E22D0
MAKLSGYPIATYYECSSAPSWEEKAFAEDAAGCVWPPRSYSCSFCRREFPSAQALGGHMNVHRRDRARLLSQTASEDEGTHVSSHLLLSSAAAAAGHPNPYPDSRVPFLQGEGEGEGVAWNFKKLDRKRSWIEYDEDDEGIMISSNRRRRRRIVSHEPGHSFDFMNREQQMDHIPVEELDLELRLG